MFVSHPLLRQTASHSLSEELTCEPIAFKHCPRVFASFRKDVEGLGDKFIREPLSVPDKLAPFSKDATSFKSEQKDDWLQAVSDLSQPFHEGSMVAYEGGETSGLKRLHHYVHEGGQSAPVFTYKQTRNSLAGVDDSTHFSAWLQSGALSPRKIAHEVYKAQAQFGSDVNSYWVIFELLWRDYFKYRESGSPCIHWPCSKKELRTQVFADTGSTLFHLYGFKEETVNNAPPKKSRHHGHQDKSHQKKEAQLETPLPAWTRDQDRYDRWVQGTTGVPFIDANVGSLQLFGSPSKPASADLSHSFRCESWLQLDT